MAENIIKNKQIKNHSPNPQRTTIRKPVSNFFKWNCQIEDWKKKKKPKTNTQKHLNSHQAIEQEKNLGLRALQYFLSSVFDDHLKEVLDKPFQ